MDKLLTCGNCEELKLTVHGTALALAAVMCAYNAAAWLLRREKHLAINTALYTALTAWEVHHVAHHWSLIESRRRPATPGADPRVEKAAA